MKKVNYFLLLFFLWGKAFYAQDSLKVLDALYNDFSIPDASAFSLLGINPSKITRPSSTKELSSALVNVANSGKGISPGIALEWAPLMTFDKRMVKYDSIHKIYQDFKHYQKTFFRRNLQLSFATVQDSVGSKIGLGLSCVVFDKSDPVNSEQYAFNLMYVLSESLHPLMSYNEIKSQFLEIKKKAYEKLEISITADPTFYLNGACQTSYFDEEDKLPASEDLIDSMKDSIVKIYTDKLKIQKGDKKRKTLVTDLVNEYMNALFIYRKIKNDDKATFLKTLKKQQSEYKKEHWNDGMLKFGVGQVWNSSDNAWKNLQSQKVTAYGAWAIPVGKTWGQLILLSQFGYNYSSDSINLAQVICGARLLAGNNNLHGSIEIANQYYEYRKTEFFDVKSKNNLRSTVGLEFKMSEGFWLEFAVGVDADSKDFYKTARMLSMANIKYTFKKEARFNLQQ